MDVSEGGDNAVFVNAYKASPVQHVKLVNCNLKGVKTPLKIDHVKDIDLKNVTINGNLVAVPDSPKNR